MRVALLVCTFNRPEYLKQCLWSLERADLGKIDNILIVDDLSTNKETLSLIPYFVANNKKASSQQNKINSGIKGSLLWGYDFLFSGHDLVINLDSDAIVKPQLFNELIKNYIPGTLLTGFHSTNANRDGSQRHVITSETENLYLKESVGGINFCIDKQAYENFVKPVLQIEIGNWDYMACVKAGGAYCLKKSLIQHIGFDSSLNHFENPDVADEFKYWELPQVTLIGVDSNKERLQIAEKKCTENIQFASVKLLHPEIFSKEQYSEFIIKQIYKWVDTTHMLIFQHDGFINNWQAWDNDWLQYDYIGAPWHYNDGMAVGNGGFSLRSKRLMEIVAHDLNINILHPEDHHICRTYRKYLEKTYDIKFAPVEIAEKFAFEGYRQPSKFLKDQFGVHGHSPRTSPVVLSKKKYVFNQFFGLGDILFLVPMARALMDEGNEVLWPIADHYFNIAKHFPDINFVKKSAYPLIPYEHKGRIPTLWGELLPYRFAIELMGLTLKDCMQSKYQIYGHDWNMWRELTYKRDYEAEIRLAKIVLADLNGVKKYQLVNRHYGEASRGMVITPELNSDLLVVQMGTIEGFSLIDWMGIIEGASEIHTANTSVNYLIELMSLEIPVYMYKRGTWGEVGFEHTEALWKNKCWRFK
jgi:glycosyltransferase involved in cell wall biosynthesis